MYLYANKYVSGTDWFKNDKGDIQSKTSEAFSEMLKSAGLTPDDLQTDYPSAQLTIQVGYWRKVNAVHQWFVDNCGAGVDECRPYDVSRDDLTSLLRTVNEVLETRDHSQLPPQSGFFFGSTEIDEYYWSDLEGTRKMLTAILDNPKFAEVGFEYQASW
jgi:hypothetical protein